MKLNATTYYFSYIHFRSGKGRASFSLKKYVDKYKLGNPVAGNFFQAEWEDVPKK